MDKYCDKNWQDCPYAVALTQAYEKYEEGDRRALENEKIKALERELKGALSRQGRLEKKVDELRAVNQSFTRVNNELEIQKKRYFDKWKEEHKQLEDYEKRIGDQIEELTKLYEMRIAYLIETFVPPKMIYEDYALEWAKDKNYSVVGDEENGRRTWKVVFRDEDEKKKQQ